jgi:hypothetical protein
MNTFKTRNQFLLAIEMLTRACDMRMSHAKRLRILRYAHEVMVLSDASLPREANRLYRMMTALSEYDKDRIIHSEIKGIIREVRDAVQEYVDDTWSFNDVHDADIPF